jgi:hypothetical protein
VVLLSRDRCQLNDSQSLDEDGLTMTVSFTGGRAGCTTGALVGGAGVGVCEPQPTNATTINVATAIRLKRVWAFKHIMVTSPIAFGLPIIVVVVEWTMDKCDQRGVVN